MASEYYNYKQELIDRKQKLLLTPGYHEKAEVDQIMVKYTCIDKEPAEEYQKHRHTFILPEVCCSLTRRPKLPGSLQTTMHSAITGYLSRS